MPNSIYFALGIHNHQPVGNFSSVFAEAWLKAYKPFLDVVQRHPGIKFTIHYTGPLWDYLLSHQPGWLKQLKALVARGQAEVLTGSYYEAILPNIGDQDKISQIRKMTAVIKARTGYPAQGMWLAERVWEPQLAKPLAQAGVKYTILDEAHFRYAGLDKNAIFGYYLTEEQGFPLAIFPISYDLRHLIPFAPPPQTIAWLNSYATAEGNRIAVMADDGEKFGIWPGTYKTSYEEGWLENFFDMLEQNSGWIKTITFSEYLKLYPPLGRIYLPNASYFEMLEWALPTGAGKEFQSILSEVRSREQWARYEPFLKGGFWRNFLTKYPESNLMQKKALLVSEKVHAMQGKLKNQALQELWQGQCNCAYWHGVFGGLYLSHLRHAIYEHLIKAESLTDKETHGSKPWVEAQSYDLDRDSKAEILMGNGLLNLYLKPQPGGQIFELDYKPAGANYLNTLARKEEIYHDKVRELAASQSKAPDGLVSIHDMAKAKESGLDKLLNYDWYQLGALIDHFFHPATVLDNFINRTYGEQGDFVTGDYSFKLKTLDAAAKLELQRSGHVWVGANFEPLKITKSLSLKPDAAEIAVAYRITNLSASALKLWYAQEWNLAFLSGDDAGSYYQIGNQGKTQAAPGKATRLPLNSLGSQTGLEQLQIADGIRGVELDFKLSKPAALWHFPIKTVSQSDDGFESNYQSSCLVWHWQMALAPGKSWELKLKLKLAGRSAAKP